MALRLAEHMLFWEEPKSQEWDGGVKIGWRSKEWVEE